MKNTDSVNQADEKTIDNALNDVVLDDKPLENANIDEIAEEKPLPWYAGEKSKRHFTDIITRSEFLTQLLVILVTAVMRAVAVNVFANPNKLSLGGLTGIGTILYSSLGWNISLTTFIMNVPLLILAYVYINKRFALLTLLSTVLTSVFLQFFNIFPTMDNDPFASAIMSGAITGIAIGMILKVNCSGGGTDIISLLIQNKFPNAKVVWIMFVINIMTGIAAGIVFGSVSIMIYSFIAIIVSSYTCDVWQRGIVATFEVKIVTDKHREISDYVINVLHRSASVLKSKGMYSGREHDYLICIIRKRQLSELKRAVKIIDENAFIYITEVYDTIGKGFDNSVTPKSKIK